MTDFDQLIRKRIDDFVAEITDLVRRAALASAAEALGVEGQRLGGHARLDARSASAKRTASQIEKVSADIAAYVRANPGLRAEQIAKALRMSTKELVLPLRKLIATGRLSKKGERRATRYYPCKEPVGGRARTSRSRKRR